MEAKNKMTTPKSLPEALYRWKKYPVDLKISTSEMSKQDAQVLKDKLIDKTFSFDASDEKHRYKWRDVVEEVKSLPITTRYEIHFFSKNYVWIFNTIVVCKQFNPHLVNVYVQVLLPRAPFEAYDKLSNALSELKDLLKNIVWGVSIDVTSLMHKDIGRVIKILDGVKGQLTLPAKTHQDKVNPDIWLQKYSDDIIIYLGVLTSQGMSWSIDRGVEQNIVEKIITSGINLKEITIGRGLYYID